MQTAVTLRDVHATNGDGGIFYIQSIRSINISPPGSTISTYQNFSVAFPNSGSFLYSISRGASISLSNSDLSCMMNAPNYNTDLSNYLLKPDQMAKIGGAIYVQDAVKV